MKKRISVFIVIFLLLGALAMIRNHRFFGQAIGATEQGTVTDTVSVINTTALAPDVQGYGGPLPVKIHLTGNRIDSVEILPNSETPGFLNRLYEEGLVSAWNGKTLQEADTMHVDAVSGATFSSHALITNVHAGVIEALNKQGQEMKASSPVITGWDLVKWIAALLVIACAAILPFFTRNKKYRLIQQVLNVAVLGFWAGVFVDYAMMLNFFANWISFTLAGVVTVALLIVAFIYPLFGSHAHYCNWVCPYGSLQDLAGRVTKRKWKMSPKTVKGLEFFRKILWGVLIVLLATGWAASWIDYEIFTAFIVKSASWIVIVVGILFIVLSIFVPRAFCRFVCPTGTILKAY